MQPPEVCAMVTDANRLPPPEEEITNTATSVQAVEELLKYRFKNTKLLEEALTHSSCPNLITNYQRLAFVGDAALGLAISSYFFMTYPVLTVLARVAVRHGLYKYLRRDSAILDEKVKEFVITVQQEEEMEFYGGMIKAPKVLADIVESVMGAVYLDCGFDVNAVWVIFRGLLEPIIMLNTLEEQPQSVTMLFGLCKKDGKQVDVEHRKEGDKNIASVYLDGQFIASASSEHKENAKLQVPIAALKELFYNPCDKMDVEFVPFQRKKRDVESITFQKKKMDVEFDPTKECEGAKQKLNELCQREKWPKPTYRVEKEIGPAHDRRFICSVHIIIAEGILFVMGDEKSRVKDAENSAALATIRSLQESKSTSQDVTHLKLNAYNHNLGTEEKGRENKVVGVSSFRGRDGMSSSSSSAGAPVNKDRKMQSAEQLVLDLCNPNLRENALLELSKKRELFQDLPPLLWHSFGTISVFLQEIVSIYPVLSPPNLTLAQSNRVCNVLALLQCVASHPDTRLLLLNAYIPLYLYPFLNTTSKSTPFEYLRLTSLGVIGALVKVDNTEVISFLVSTEIVPRCLCTMEMGSELSKTVAIFIVQKILLDDVGLNYICTTSDRFFEVAQVLGNMVGALAEQPSSRLLKHIIRCYLRLSDEPRACQALKICLPDMLRDDTFSSCLREDPITRRWLQQLLLNVNGNRVALQAGGFDHMP
ncbi:hypothetical protein KY289_004936 [Solanum tuberosum]|nr:hypothetical protein KY289_004936 [Solanum tuberosum]